MKREFVCIVCPKSCALTVDASGGCGLRVAGEQCNRGIAFAQQEVHDPQRILTTTVKLVTGDLLPMRSNGTVKKRELIPLLAQLKTAIVVPPVKIGQVVAGSMGENRVDIVAAGEA